MELKGRYYILALLLISYTFFVTVVSTVGGTKVVYIDLLLSIAVIHYLLSKFFTIRQYRRKFFSVKMRKRSEFL
ncbi:hypothetical protein [Ornithinibacillus halotolerans]|uniref:Uncharacterized protein n=1 Tax=Ornithinibacillus halotolerans TaxID=1274357 RepID=A0A916W5P5_9BACI|nr:hypothetical protein [Ornithinibacillus halotolerans]GGA67931.1 hypothetical protein GCM10008025_09740 [Ornithinibacillus halotolerans]